MNILDLSQEYHSKVERRAFLSRVTRFMVRIRFQLGGALLIGVFLPLLLRVKLENFPDHIANYDNSFVGTAAALFLGYMTFRKMSALPGSHTFANILPAFLTSYLFIFAVFFALRLSYSRAQFLLSFLFVLMWFYAVSFLVARFRVSRFGLVQLQSRQSPELPNISWLPVSTPEAAGETQLPLVADLDSKHLTDDWQRYLAEEAIRGRRIFNLNQFVESLEGRVTIRRPSENSFGHLAPDSLYAPGKRYLDAGSAAIVLICVLPLMLIIAALIRLDSSGPALFRQERMGFRGKPFTVYKFRSMRERSEEIDPIAADMTQSDDHRITRIGHFIRKTRLDELPQIFNILKGEMSWIGPRPETTNLSKMYEEQIPFYRYRHIVRPGITGWAQVKQGHVTSVEDVVTKLEYDFYYVKHFSIWTDALIVIQTIKVMLTGHGAK